MSWWNRNKKIVLRFLVGTLLSISLIFTSLSLLGWYLSHYAFCTLEICFGSLNIELSNLPPETPYQIEITFPSGETRILACELKTNTNSLRDCTTKNASFLLDPDFAPEEIIVTVTANDKTVSKLFHPTYDRGRRINYEASCPPPYFCYSSTVKFDFVQ